MKTFRFRDFPIYKEARVFRKLVQSFIKTFPKSENFRLADQIHRSALSIQLNIAEGSAKLSDKDFARFLETSIASTNETVAAFDAAYDDGLINAKNLIAIEKVAGNLARQTGGFIQHLRRTTNKR